MIRKILILIVVLVVVMIGLQIFGGRDFSQISLAYDKYQTKGEISTFLSDIGVMFSGGKVKEGVLPSSRYANQVLYRWKDSNGIVQVTERKPDVGQYEVIKLGDLNYQIEEGMSEEQIKALLKKDKK